MVWLGALMFLLISTIGLILGSRPPTSLAAVLQGVDDERAGRKP
jgi:hypothetical protein